MKIGIYKEIVISLFKPHLYHKLKELSVARVLAFNFITTLMTIIFLILLNFIIALLTRSFVGIGNYFDSFTLVALTTSVLYMVFGLFIGSILVSLLLLSIFRIKKKKLINYRNLFNYATHSLLICELLKNFVGAYVIVFALGYCIMAVSHETSEVST